jgi:hypothetical protein
MKIIDNKIWRDGQKIGWLENEHVRSEADGRKMGYFENNFVYNAAGHKVAYIFENELKFQNGASPVSLQSINEEIEGNVPLLAKCAVRVLMDEEN